jgi:DNA-directed RNA polymerase specialized sigma24 family protein
MVINTGYPQDYDRLDGEWLMFYQVAHRFERKVPIEDREDIRHSIILELALARRRMGSKPIGEAFMYRVASYVIADHWRKASRKPTIFSLDREVDTGDSTGLMDTVIDDNAIDVTAWLDAKTWLLGCPNRLIQIAMKRVNKIPLDRKDQKYLERFRIQERQRLLNYVAN